MCPRIYLKPKTKKTMDEHIKEVFDYYNVTSGVDSIFGDWVVSDEADVINVEKYYPIYTPQVQSGNLDYWCEHLSKKTWFDASEERNFRKAYERAEEILQNR